jgi:erythromycin esterase-like protein
MSSLLHSKRSYSEATVNEDVVDSIVASAKKVDSYYQGILDSISDDVNVVMIGEASHGTEEFYRHRAEISKRLIQEKGFTIIGLESDWPDTNRVNQFVNGQGSDTSAIQALSNYERFPAWMWKNDVVAEFTEWLRLHNSGKSANNRVGIHGLDVYSLENSRDEVLSFFDKYYPNMYHLAENAYSGSKRRRADIKKSDKLVQELERLEEQCPSSEEVFIATQNARCVSGAARYYTMEDRVSSWNHRDTFMFNTLSRLIKRRTMLDGKQAKAIIWAHNSHLGDSRYTYMHGVHKLNLGRLVREKWGMDHVMNIGFTTHTGTVTAASNWDDEPEYKKVNPSMNGSVEQVMHRANEKIGQANEFLLVFRSTASDKYLATTEAIRNLSLSHIERAIGVIYRPRTERSSHYFDAKIAKQFDMVIHVENTTALTPIGVYPQGERSPTLCY